MPERIGVASWGRGEGTPARDRGSEPFSNRRAARAQPQHVAGIAQGGEWIVEQPSDIHEAANKGSQPVVLYLATLLKTGAPPSTPVSVPPAR